MGKWANKYIITNRRKRDSKSKIVAERLPKLQRFHFKLRTLMTKPAPCSCASAMWATVVGGHSAGGEGGDGAGEPFASKAAKYGRFPSERRCIVDGANSHIQ